MQDGHLDKEGLAHRFARDFLLSSERAAGHVSGASGKEAAKFCTSYKKINPNGVDLAPMQVMKIPSNSTIYVKGDDRGYADKSGVVSDLKTEVRPDHEGFYHFEKGGLYELRFPKVRLPEDFTGFAFPRSTMNRLGIVKLETAVFDSGYEGQPTQTIFTPLKALVHKDEAFVQLVFIRNETPAKELYNGRYQNEKAKS